MILIVRLFLVLVLFTPFSDDAMAMQASSSRLIAIDNIIKNIERSQETAKKELESANMALAELKKELAELKLQLAKHLK